VGPGGKTEESSVFDFPMPEGGSGVDVAGDILAPSPGSTPKQPKSGPRRTDSDVHLILDEGATFNPASDSGLKKEGSSSKSDVKLGVAPDSGVKSDSGSGPKSGTKKKTALPPGSRVDSGVRLVPMDSDDVESIQHEPGRAPSDSSVRVEPDSSPPGGKVHGAGYEHLPTEEVDLDAELRKAEEAAKGHKPRTRVKPKSGVAGPVADSPESTELELPADELQLEQGEDVTLGELAPKDVLKGSSGASGIGMHSPADSGVDLEKAGQPEESSEFELSLEPPAKGKGPKTPAAGEPEGSSEFELTLDEGGLAPLEEDSGDKDIFETDFDMPALEDESGSEAVALDEPDTNLESSDFDLSTGEGGTGQNESGSQVVALDEEEADEAAATVAKRRAEVVKEEGEEEEIDELVGEEAAEEELQPVATAAPAEWGKLPAILMIPCVLFMGLLAILSFELLHSMWGYNQPYKPTGAILKPLADMTVGDDTKK
jgi:hypothetical protein